MAFFTDLIDGATEVPRTIIGGVATALGADHEETKNVLRLNENHEPLRTQLHQEFSDNPTGFFDMIQQHPGKILGEMAMYAFLPMRLFGKTATKAGATRGAKLKDVANQAATFGTYGAVEETASAALNDREAHPIQRFATDAVITAAALGALKGAVAGASKIKSKAKKSEWMRNYLTDVGFPPRDSKVFAEMGDADKAALITRLNASLENTGNALRAATRNVQPSLEMKVGDTLPKKGKLAGEQIKDIIKRTGFVAEDARPVKKIEPKKSNISKEAIPAVEKIRERANDADAHAANIDRHAFALATKIKEILPNPESRQKVAAYLDVGGKDIALSEEEKVVADSVRATLDDMGRTLVEAGIIKNFREDYIPHILRDAERGDMGFMDKLLADAAIRSKTSTFTDRALRREDERALSEKDALTTDIADLVQLYTINVARAVANKGLMDSIDHNLISLSAKDGWKEATASTHPALITQVVKKQFKDDLSQTWKTLQGKVKQGEMTEQDANERMLAYFDQLKGNTKAYVHPDYMPSLDMLTRTTDLPTVAKVLIALNFASKRMLIMGSLFHFNALAESALFAGAGGFGAVAKGAGAGFLISGGNPLGAAVGAGMGAGLHVLIRTKDIISAMRGGKYGDQYDYVLRYVDIRPPRDVGNDETYAALHSVQETIDKYIPSGLAKGVLKKGTSGVKGVNKAIDILMWHRLMAGAKTQVFYSKLEQLMKMNLDLPVEQRKSQHELATIAGQFVNDAFGGQNWRRLAENVDNKWGRKIATALASPLGMTKLNLGVFAPDWTVSNVRVLGKAFPGIEKDPMVRKLYRDYALRAAMYYMIVGSAIQMALTGKPIFENDDPLKYDLGDGRTMTFSKQLSEPFHWISNPLHEAHVKTSSLVKLVEEQVTNRQYAAGNAPAITSEEDTAFEAVGERLKIAGKHFAPIFVQDIGRNGPEGVYGFFGHPIYGHIRYGFKNASGELPATYKEDNNE